jgi:hypothetical protein
MKTTNTVVMLTAILMLAFFSQVSENVPYSVNLKVTLDDKSVPPPPKVTLTLGKRSVQVPVVDGRFEVPRDIELAEKRADVSVSTVVGDDQVRFSIMAGVLKHEYWTLRLADGRFKDEYQSRIHKGQNSGSVCVLEFRDKDSETSALIAPNCRNKAQK